jgi:DNA-binding MarR family transcriptional regulator
MGKAKTPSDGGDPSLLGQFMYVARLCRAERTRLLSASKLHAGQDALLAALAEEDGQTMGKLAARLAIRPPTATKMVARMAGQGLVRREASPDDSRIALVFLSEASSRVVAAAEDARRRGEEKAFAALKDKDLRRLRKILAKIRQSLGDAEPAGAP